MEALRQVITDQGYEYLGIPDDVREDPIAAAREREEKDLKTRFTIGIILSVDHLRGIDAALVSLPPWDPHGCPCLSSCFF